MESGGGERRGDRWEGSERASGERPRRPKGVRGVHTGDNERAGTLGRLPTPTGSFGRKEADVPRHASTPIACTNLEVKAPMPPLADMQRSRTLSLTDA